MSELPETDATVEDDFDDLDALLDGAMKLAAARKAAKSKRPMTDEEAEIYAAAERTWQPTTAIAHFIRSECSCGACSTRFNSWYILHEHMRQDDVHKLVKSEGHDDLPAMHHTTDESTTYCIECLTEEQLPAITPIPVLDPLGEQATGDADDQRELQLEEASALDDMLAELNAELDETFAPLDEEAAA